MIDFNILQNKYDLIYSFFKTTSEPFDNLEFDGNELLVILNDKVVEKYSIDDINEFLGLN